MMTSQGPRRVDAEKDDEYYDFACPKCGEKKVKRFVYGLIDDPFALSSREVPGGCCVTDDSPKWYCEACEHEWGRI